MKAEPCYHRTLAEGELSKVDVCGCGMLHLTIGPFTLRLEAHAAAEVLATLGLAIARLNLGQPAAGRLHAASS